MALAMSAGNQVEDTVTLSAGNQVEDTVTLAQQERQKQGIKLFAFPNSVSDDIFVIFKLVSLSVIVK
jgi:hypothetical protein